jgi:hypothetical protein
MNKSTNTQLNYINSSNKIINIKSLYTKFIKNYIFLSKLAEVEMKLKKQL